MRDAYREAVDELAYLDILIVNAALEFTEAWMLDSEPDWSDAAEKIVAAVVARRRVLSDARGGA